MLEVIFYLIYNFTVLGFYGLDEEEIKPKEEELDLKFLEEI